MKTRKTVIAILAAVLLISAALIAGCTDPIITPDKQDADDYVNYQIPAGMGVFRLKLTDINARTILPGKGGAGLQLEGMYFDIVFTPVPAAPALTFPSDIPGQAGTNPGAKATYTDVTAPFGITDGTYTFVINAYNNATGTIKIATYNSGTSTIGISTGMTTTAGPFNLVGVVTGIDEGFLSYHITIQDDEYDNTDLIEIYESDDDTTPYDTVPLTYIVNDPDLDLDYTDTVALKPGYYIVKVTLTKDRHMTRQYTEALHIYPAMTSKMADLNIPTLVQNIFEVTFDTNEDTLTLTDSSYSSVAGAPIDVAYGNYATKPSPDPAVNEEFKFNGWYDEDTGGLLWDWSGSGGYLYRITADKTLYAQWVQKKAIDITFVINELAEITGAATLYKGISGTSSWLSGANTITLTLSPPEPGEDWDSIVWSTDGGISLSFNEDELELEITNAGDGTFGSLLNSGYFTVTAVAMYDSVPYSAIYTITVVAGNVP
jgi:hypothetical protein